jgi:mannose-6-phosphate isomerase
MAVERARVHAVQKPWGVADLRPWSTADHDGGHLIGEIWYERSGNESSAPSLLLKLLLTSQPLSIQVHPDDAYAQAIGLACGKTEAWYVLSAAPGAKIALGLKTQLEPRELREAVNDGSIADLVAWQTVQRRDVVFVPAGTIHAIGADLVIAEIQQRSDATFRMFDFGRKRELHIADAVAVANAGPADAGPQPRRLTDERTLLASNQHFVLERN